MSLGIAVMMFLTESSRFSRYCVSFLQMYTETTSGIRMRSTLSYLSQEYETSGVLSRDLRGGRRQLGKMRVKFPSGHDFLSWTYRDKFRHRDFSSAGADETPFVGLLRTDRNIMFHQLILPPFSPSPLVNLLMINSHVAVYLSGSEL